MKTIFQFSIIVLLLSFSEVNAQQSDSTAFIPITIKKSYIFLVEIKTDSSAKKGILYDADSSGIVILDSFYRKITIPLSKIKSLIVRRSNAGGYGFKKGLINGGIATGLVGTVYALGLSGLSGSFLVLNAVLGVGYFAILGGIAFGFIFAIVSSSIPNLSFGVKSQKDYYRYLKRIQRKTQIFLMNNNPVKLQLVKPKY
jgi:hypothetical protein